MWQSINLYICAFIMMIGILLYARIAFDKSLQISKFHCLIVLIIDCFIHTVSSIFFDGAIKTLIMFIANMEFLKISFNISNKKAIWATFIYMIVLLIPELIEVFVFTNIFGMSRDFFYEIYAGSILANFSICILITITTYILKHPLKKLLNYEIENNKQIIIFSILIFICTCLFFYTLIKEFRFNDNVLLYLIAILVLIFALISLIKQVILNKKITTKYDKLLEFMTTYEEELEKTKIFNHETKNEFLTIRAKMSDKEDDEEIIKYIDEILDDKIIIRQEKYLKFTNLPPNGIKGLCYLKVQSAEKLGLKVGITMSKKIKDSNIYNLDVKRQRELAKILGVFLDNAIEASASSLKKQIGIEGYVTKLQEFKMIITNSFNNEINIDKIGNKQFSTKGKNRGHGLLLVKHIVKNSNYFDISTQIKDDIYIQTIIVKSMQSN